MRSAATKHISRWAVVRNALGNPNLVKVEVGTAIGVLGHRAYGAVLLVIAYEQFGKFGAPLFATVRLLGGAVGVLVYSALAGRFRRERVLAGGFLANAVAVALLAGRRSLSVSLAIGLLICASAMFVLSVTSGIAVALPLLSLFSLGMLYQAVSSRTLLQSTATGRSLDLLIGVNILIALPVQAVSNLGAGVLNDGVGVRATLQVAAGVAILGAVYSLCRLTKVEKQAPTNREEVDAIRRVDAFRPLSVAAANQLADALVDQETAEYEVVVRQGEPGDDMFLIRSGVFDTTVDGEHARTLQHGDHFGEIALLFNAPRTATVRCTQAGALWRLRRDDFLRAITGNSTTEAAIKAIADQRLAHAGAVDLSQGDGR